MTQFGVGILTFHLWLILQNNNTRVVTIDGYEDVPRDDEKSLKKAVAHQPVSVAIEASSQAFQLYKSVNFQSLKKLDWFFILDSIIGFSLNHKIICFVFIFQGVMTGTCGISLDHGVVVVGYGSTSGEDYWIIRNSWGLNWGDSGYVKLQRNIDDPFGKCGIAMMPSYPTKSSFPSSFDLLSEIWFDLPVND